MHQVITEGIECLKLLVQRKLFSETKEKVSLVLCGTAVSTNNLANSIGNFPHISLVRDLLDIDWDLLEFLNSGDLLSTVQADVMDALIVGVDHLLSGSKTIKRLSERRILLVSNLEGPGDRLKLKRLISELHTADVQLSLLGRSFREDAFPSIRLPLAPSQPDPSSAPIDVDQSGLHKSAFKVVYNLWHQVGGESYTFAEIRPALAHFETRAVAQRGWRVDLRIGDSFALPVEGYVKVKETRPPPLISLYAADPSIPIRASANYLPMDEHPVPLDSSQVIRGYLYGDTLVPFSDADTAAIKLSSEKCLCVIGFTSSHNVPRSLYVGDSVTVFVSSDSAEDSPSTLGLSALTQALIELDEVALVRRVYSRTSAPRLGVLTPEIQGNQVSLAYADLGFAEDFRAFQFPNLPTTAESDVLAQSALDSMEAFIDSMLLESELSDYSIDREHFEDNGVGINDSTDVNPTQLPNPWIQRLFCLFSVRGLSSFQSYPTEAPQNSTNQWLDPNAFPGLEPLLTRVGSAVVVKAREDLINVLPALSTTDLENTEEPVASVAKRRRLMLSQLFGLSSDGSGFQTHMTLKPESVSDADDMIAGCLYSPYPKSEKFHKDDHNATKNDMGQNDHSDQGQLATAPCPSDQPDVERHEAVISRLTFHKQLSVPDLIHNLD